MHVDKQASTGAPCSPLCSVSVWWTPGRCHPALLLTRGEDSGLLPYCTALQGHDSILVSGPMTQCRSALTKEAAGVFLTISACSNTISTNKPTQTKIPNHGSEAKMVKFDTFRYQITTSETTLNSKSVSLLCQSCKSLWNNISTIFLLHNKQKRKQKLASCAFKNHMFLAATK